MPTLVTSLKFITSIFLTMILIFLVTKRDIVSNIKKPSTVKNTNNPVSLYPETVTREVSDAAPLNTTEENTAPDDATNTNLPPSNNSAEVLTPYEKMTEEASDTDESYRSSVSPCTTSTGYKIGTFDSRFDISKEMFLQEINHAASLWGNALGKDLFHYEEKGALTINLIYDERQARTQDVTYLALEIENSKQAAEEIKRLYEEEKSVYLAQEELFLKDTEAFQAKNKMYAEKVATYNQKGGASKAEYDEMMTTLETLKQEAASLDVRKADLMLMVESVNKKVAKHNELVAYINGLIRQSNALGAKKFTEGKFSSKNNTIDIYQYNDLTKLRRVIAHELGHALGIINHTKGVTSIMYSVNSANTTALSEEDVEALRMVCNSY